MGTYLRPARPRRGARGARRGRGPAGRRGSSSRARRTTTRRASGGAVDEDVLDVTALARARAAMAASADGGWRIGARTTWTDLVGAAAARRCSTGCERAARADRRPAGPGPRPRSSATSATPRRRRTASRTCSRSTRSSSSRPRRGARRVPIAAFVTGNRRDGPRRRRARDRPVRPGAGRGRRPSRSTFEKLGSRAYLVISIAMVAAVLEVDADGRIARARVAVGACSEVAQRLRVARGASSRGRAATPAIARPRPAGAPRGPDADRRRPGQCRLPARGGRRSLVRRALEERRSRDRLDVDLHGQRRGRRRSRSTRCAASPTSCATTSGLTGHEGRLRGRRLRRVHRPARTAARSRRCLVPVAQAAGSEVRTVEGLAGRGRAAVERPAGGVPRRRRRPVRDLHARDAHGRRRPPRGGPESPTSRRSATRSAACSAGARATEDRRGGRRDARCAARDRRDGRRAPGAGAPPARGRHAVGRASRRSTACRGCSGTAALRRGRATGGVPRAAGGPVAARAGAVQDRRPRAAATHGYPGLVRVLTAADIPGPEPVRDLRRPARTSRRSPTAWSATAARPSSRSSATRRPSPRSTTRERPDRVGAAAAARSASTTRSPPTRRGSTTRRPGTS